jgi:hypothetical protein
MAVLINELEIVLDPDANKQKDQTPKPGAKGPQPQTPPLGTLDVLTVLDREQRNSLRLLAH